ncbi:MAG: thermonuclease family protein, partial [Candidatus Omnitrophica bacterium]|nr:thermonuclease family protein [Candidatus Omnitrophota bacterium]
GQLSWDKQRDLLSINEADQRAGLTQKAAEAKWTRAILRGEIKKLKASKQITLRPQPEEPALVPAPKGVVGVYQIIEQEGCLKLDLGFSCYLDAARVGAKRFKVGDIVTALSLRVLRAGPSNLGTDELFTYNAIVTEVIDGDTFHCLIDLGFGLTLKERVRLRRLNAPEVITAEGGRAKKVLTRILKRAGNAITIKVSKTDDHDQYGRYLVDVWIGDACIDQELLDSGAFEVRGGE